MLSRLNLICTIVLVSSLLPGTRAAISGASVPGDAGVREGRGGPPTQSLGTATAPRRGFHNAVTLGAGSGPQSLVVADLNHDGIADVVVADGCGDLNCTTTGVVTVLLGAGDGTFHKIGQFVAGPPGTSADSVAAGDFNGDGDMDVAVVNSGINFLGTVTILFGNGDGTFGPPVSYSGGDAPVTVAVGDFNGDQHLDLALVDNPHNMVGILLNNGDGTFGAPVTYLVENGPQGIAVADLNHDGKLDVAVATECGRDPLCKQGSVSILLGNGDGTFQPEVGYKVGSRPLDVAVADFNRDGNEDLAVVNSCGVDYTCASVGTVALLLGNGDGTFQAPVNYAVGYDSVRVAAGEFNNDDSPGVVATNYTVGTISVLAGNGDGTLQKAMTYTVGMEPRGAAIADFNGDHSADLVIVNQISNSVSILLNARGTGVTLASAPNPSKLGQAVTITATVTATLTGAGTPTGR